MKEKEYFKISRKPEESYAADAQPQCNLYFCLISIIVLMKKKRKTKQTKKIYCNIDDALVTFFYWETGEEIKEADFL